MNSTSLVLTYNEPLDTTSVPATGDFSVGTDGEAQTVTAVGVSGTDVTLTLSPGVASVDTVTVSYTADVNPIQDTAPAGNDAADLVNQPVTNTTPAPGAGINAHVEGTEISYFNKGNPSNRGPRIKISVEDDAGAAVAGATVDITLTLPDLSTLAADGTTDSSGQVTFKLTGSDLDGDYTNAVANISGTDISFVQCHPAAGIPDDESTVTFTVAGTTATETGVVDECAP